MGSCLHIIVGAEVMYVERNGVRSAEATLTEKDGPDEVRQKADELWQTIRRIVSHLVWVRHRLIMAGQRRGASHVALHWPGPYFRGPRPDLIALRPWENAVYGQWTSLPHGVVHRLLRCHNQEITACSPAEIVAQFKETKHGQG